MANDANERYTLYALPLTTDNIFVAAGHRFSRATPTPEPGYVLIYTNGEAPKGAEIIGEERASMLSVADMRWLCDNRVALIADELERHKDEVPTELAKTIEALETELQRKKQEISQRGE